MPKIIKNLEQNILDCGEKLFAINGYAKVNMRMIAREAGIAVGTLYNYYENKEQLFVKVFERGWERNINSLNNVVMSPDLPKKKLSRFVIQLYESIESMKGIGCELLKVNAFKSKKQNINGFNDCKGKIEELGNLLEEKIYELINKTCGSNKFSFENGMERRLANTLLLLTWSLLMRYPNEKDKNIEFINIIINLTFTDK